MVAPARHSTRPPWDGPETGPPGAPLADGLKTEVCVVGAGIAGACLAYELTRQGRSVVVIDDGPVAGGETGRSTAHVTNALDDRYYILEQAHGRAAVRRIAQSHAAAIEFYEQFAAIADIGFSRVDGYLVLPEHRTSADLLERELAAATHAGVQARMSGGAVRWGGFDWGPGLVFPEQGQIDPVAAARAMLERAVSRGATLHLDCHVDRVDGGKDAGVTTSDGRRVKAEHVVVATNTPVNDRVVVHTKQSAFRTYAIAIALERAEPEPGLLWDGLWEDDRSYHYLRWARLRAPGLPNAGWYLILGGEDHKTGQDEPERPDHYERLESWARDRLHDLGPVAFRWSGQVMEPHDGLAFIGRNPMDADNVYIVTGDSGNGITHAAIAGMLIPDLIAGRLNPWAAVYDPARKPFRSLAGFLRENANSVAKYSDWVRRGGVEREEDLRPGQGAVIAHGVRKLAVYCDQNGKVHRCSATCPHLGGVVRWNEAEGTWDCPVHGSRFDPHGKVINGPANRDLEPVQEQPPARAEQAAPPSPMQF